MQQGSDNFYILLFIAAGGFIVLALLATTAVILSRMRHLRQERARQELAVQHQKALVQAAVASQEEERTYIGSELHDHIISLLMVLKLSVERKDSVVLNEQADRIIAAVRTLSHRLSPPALRLFGLSEAVLELAASLQSVGPELLTEVHEVERDELPGEKALHLYRIVQELTTNTLRYAKAANIYIGLLKKEGRLQLIYHDDGKGFDNLNTSRHGNGLHNIQSRIQLLQASHSFVTAPGKGVQVTVEIELSSPVPLITPA